MHFVTDTILYTITIIVLEVTVRVILALTRLHRLGALRGSQGLAEG